MDTYLKRKRSIDPLVAIDAMDSNYSIVAHFPETNVIYKIQRIQDNGRAYMPMYYSPLEAEDYYNICGTYMTYDDMLALLKQSTYIEVHPYYVRKVLD